MSSIGTFRERVDEALGDVRLHQAVFTATTERDERRRKAWAELPDAQALRELAKGIKDHTLDNLDRYLDEFIGNLRRMGVEVHLASTAEEANAAVVEIAKQHGCDRAAKSKSMLTEELDLNDALIEAGIDVVETDLGEFLLQLEGDRPSHITCPAVHKDVASCAKTFEEKLGLPYVEDPVTLVRSARKTMRDKFRAAEMGITGVNFAVAESGTVVLVMNEGNGRYCALNPKVHVAVMGMEKIVPTLKDAAVMLKLLGRSATAQRLSVDTHFITGPKRAGDIDGPEKMHIVIVDAGRSGLLKGKYRDALRCIRCGACLNVCPVYRSIGGHAYGGVYPGPIGKLLTTLLDGSEDSLTLPHASSLCGACLEACPVKIDIPHMLVELRTDQAAVKRGPRGKQRMLRLVTFMLRSPRRYAAGQRFAGMLLRMRAKDGWVRKAPGPLAGWTNANRDLPAPAAKSFRRLWKEGRV